MQNAASLLQAEVADVHPHDAIKTLNWDELAQQLPFATAEIDQALRLEMPNDVGNAILRAKRKNEEGHAVLLEFMTSAETAFSHRGGRADH